MEALPEATIIVLNWNGRSYLETCVEALYNQTTEPQHIVLVDNDSSDDSVAFVKERFPDVEILENELNLGYAGGNNSALRSVESEIAILVNPDIVARHDWLENLLKAFEENPAAGIAGCKLLFPGEQQIQHAGGLITHPRAMPQHRDMYGKDTGQYAVTADVDFVTGAALAVRRELLEKTGYLDEGFFMYFEDADWCTRARRDGFRVVYVPLAKAVHDESAIAVRGSLSYLRNFHTGRWRYLLKHFSAMEIIEQTLPAEVEWLKEIESDERRALGWAYRDALRRFPAIMEARVAHGAAELSLADRATIISTLLDMRRAALLWAEDPDAWPKLLSAGKIDPKPFKSTVPLLGPLFARLRDVWAAVATKAYVGALSAQQNDFNRSITEELQLIEQRLREFEDHWLEQEKYQRELSWELNALQVEFDQTQRLLARIEARLADRAGRNDQIS